LIVAFLALTELCVATNYKWTDAEGNVHYGDKPPPGAPFEQVRTQSITPEQAAQGEALRLKMLEQTGRDKALASEREAAAVAAESAALARAIELAPLCLEARKKLDVLHERMPVYRTPTGELRVRHVEDVYEGERTYLDDAARSAEIAGVEQVIANTCHPHIDPGQAFARQQQIMSEKCAAKRARLARLSDPATHTADSEIATARTDVATWCSN
jgi:hypothetical protein